jgi:hypothetical protein
VGELSEAPAGDSEARRRLLDSLHFAERLSLAGIVQRNHRSAAAAPTLWSRVVERMQRELPEETS